MNDQVLNAARFSNLEVLNELSPSAHRFLRRFRPYLAPPPSARGRNKGGEIEEGYREVLERLEEGRTVVHKLKGLEEGKHGDGGLSYAKVPATPQGSVHHFDGIELRLEVERTRKVIAELTCVFPIN